MTGRKAHRLLPRVHEVTTSDLLVGDTLLTARARAEARRCQPSPLGVAAGIVYGDGTKTRTVGAAVSLFGAKVELLRFFPEPRVHTYVRPDGVVDMRVDNLPLHFKDLPPASESTGYLLGWLAGMIATDGSVSEDGTVTLSTADEQTAMFIRDLCPRLGVGVNTGTQKRGENSYAPGTDHILKFVRSTLGPDFFVRADQRERYGDSERTPADWSVSSVSPSVREQVYCATVEGTGSFTLAGDILTGNCDLNSDRHPLGRRGTFTPRQAATIRALAVKYGLRWGGSYVGRADEMHAEVILPIERALDLVRRLQRPPVKPAVAAPLRYAPRRPLTRGQRVLNVQRALVRLGYRCTPDGTYGPGTSHAVREFQRGHKLTPDGVVGAVTLAALRRAIGH